jgi:hypothetical protein
MPALIKIVVWICVMMAVPAAAQEVQLGLLTQIQAESNVFRATGDGTSLRPHKADGIFRLTPDFRIQDQRKRLNYNIHYAPTLEQFFDTPVLSGWNHVVAAVGSFEFSPSAALTADVRYADVRSRSTGTPIDGDPNVDPGAGFDNQALRYRHFRAVLGYRKSFGPSLNGSADLTYQQYEFSGLNTSNNRSVSGSMSLQHGVSQRLSVGFGGTGVYQDFEGSVRRLPSRTIVARLYVLLNYAITKSTVLSLNIGPSVFDTEQRLRDQSTFTVPLYATNAAFPDEAVLFTNSMGNPNCGSIAGVSILSSCPVNANTVASKPGAFGTLVDIPYADDASAGEPSQHWTYFANALLRKQWKRATASLSYRRTDSAASANGLGTVLDAAALRTSWNMLEDLTLSFRATWYTQQDTSDRATLQGVRVEDVDDFAESQEVVTLESGLFTFKQQGIQTAVIAKYLLSRHSSVIGTYRYDNVLTSTTRLGAGTAWDNHTLSIGFLYEFEPFRF